MRAYSHRLIVLAKRAKRTADVGTQKIRGKLLQDLEEMFDMAKSFATDESVKVKQRQIWIRIAAYIGQVINSLSKTFDEATVARDLEVLEKMINEAVAKEKNKGAQTTAPRSPRS